MCRNTGIFHIFACACAFRHSGVQFLDIWTNGSEHHVLYIFTSKFAFRHSGVHFFDIRASKSAPNTSCFVHFHFHICVWPQRRAIFRHQNFKKCSKHLMFCALSFPHVLFATAACIFSTSELQKKRSHHEVLWAFSLPHVLLATAACNFSTSELQKVRRKWRLLYTFISQCAFRQSGVQFLLSPLSPYLRTRRFNRPTFRLTRHTNHWKNTAFHDFSNIWRGFFFFWLSRLCIVFLPTWLPVSSAFQLSICRKFANLNFLWLFIFSTIDIWKLIIYLKNIRSHMIFSK